MVAYAMHLLRTEAIREVSIHPEGTHGKQFDFKRWLKGQGFTLTTPSGSTAYGGRYTRADGAAIVIPPKSGSAMCRLRCLAVRLRRNAKAAS